MNVFHMSTARLAGRPAGLDELTAGAGDRRCRRLASTALLGIQEPCRALLHVALVCCVIIQLLAATLNKDVFIHSFIHTLGCRYDSTGRLVVACWWVRRSSVAWLHSNKNVSRSILHVSRHVDLSVSAATVSNWSVAWDAALLNSLWLFCDQRSASFDLRCT